MNARFWEFINNGWVKLTLEPGQALHHYVRHHTDEGYTDEGTKWKLSQRFPVVFRTFVQQGCDCDGRLDTYDLSKCSITNLRVNHTSFILKDGMSLPRWTQVKTEQRDYAAEAMGY